MRVGVLGPIAVDATHGGRVALSGSKMRGLVAMLALETGNPVSPQRLLDAVWGDDDATSVNAVQVTVSKLRRTLADAGEADRITTVPSGYQLEVDRQDVDALAFEALLDEAHRPELGAEAVADVLTSALALWRGAALADAPGTAVTDAVRARLEELHHVTVEDLVDAELALGRHRRLAPELEALVKAAPLRERRWGQLMRALCGAGQQADALRAFQRAREVLVEQMGIEPGLELRRLEAAVLAQDDTVLEAPRQAAPVGAPGRAGPPVGGGFRRRGNLRYPVGSCVGRVDDLDRLLGLAKRHRLVTLVGTGGVGKTRLALELAPRLLPDVPDGVWWVDLTAARDGPDVVAGIQRSLQLDPTGADVGAGISEVVTVLGDRTATLVLDNCEQLLGSIEAIVSDLLGRCPGLRVVATSRAALAVGGEVLFAVEPLDLAAAVSLFEERIEGLGIDAHGSGDAVERLCERLDRLPLAVELAAARARHLSPEEILDRLSDRFELLRSRASGGARNRGDLRAVADWSYDLLEHGERLVFERLSVFSAGATIDAARAVCSCDGVVPGEVEALLDRLVDRSLVDVDRSGLHTRYRMLQTLHDYSAERLAERGTEAEARAAHAQWVQALAASTAFGVPTTGATIAAVQDEDAAVRDAIEWAVGTEPLLALDICTMLGPFWFGTMRVSAGWELLSTALRAAAHADPDRRAAAIVWAIVFGTLVHDVATADRWAEEAWAHERERADPERLGRLSFGRALAASYRSDGALSPWVDEARHHFAAAGSELGLGHVSFADGAARLVGGDLEGAASRLRDAADTFRRVRDHLGLILAISRLGELAWRRHDLDAYAELHAELLELGRESRAPGVITGATARLAHARLEQGRLAEAEQLANEAVASAGDSFMPVINGYAFKTAGLVNLALDHTDDGRAQLRAAVDFFEQGTGDLGVGLAALCWLDLCRSHVEAGELALAGETASTALDRARAAGDPWVIERAAAAVADLRPA